MDSSLDSAKVERRRKLMKAWIQAAKAYAENEDAPIKCPECQVADLKIWDVSLPTSDPVHKYKERHMLCANCGTHPVLLMGRE